ncbi:MAG: type II secretion system F family protein, partial [Planctomycetaceae bacterium]
MPHYCYSAIDSQGIQVPGTLVANSRSDALQQLSASALTPLSLTEQGASRQSGERVSTAAMSAAFSLLADQLEAGVPLLRSLQVMSEQSSDSLLGRHLSSMAGEVAEGTSLAGTMRSRPRIFSELDASMVQAGEEGGFLEHSLRRVASIRERQDQIRNTVLGAIAYPALLQDGYSRKFALGVLVTGGTLGVIIPPSIPMILYGIVTETSIVELFTAGILPGLFLTALLGSYTVFV